MPRCDGVQATRLLHEQQPEVKVVILTTYADDRSVIDALRAGAHGYLTKDTGATEIHKALQNILEDHPVIDLAVQHHLINAATAPSRRRWETSRDLPDDLTAREAEVLSLIAAGLSNSEIAERLVITEGIVKSHINHLFAKIDARDRAQAVAYAYRHGLAEPA